MDSCPACGLDGKDSIIVLKKCTGCMSIAYCSSGCQKKHWKIHKTQCTPFTITYDPAVGHQWVATRDLKPGTLILSEKPVCYSPAFSGSQWVCLACGLDFIVGDGTGESCRVSRSIRLCSKCGWPICSVKCEKNPMHAENECKIFAQEQTPFPPSFADFVKNNHHHNDDDDDDNGGGGHRDNVDPEFDSSLEQEGDLEKGNLISKFVDVIRGLGWRQRDRKAYDDMMKKPYILDDEVVTLGHGSVDLIRRRVTLLKKFIRMDHFQLNGEEGDRELVNFMRQEPWNKFVCAAEEGEGIKRAIVHGTYLKTSRMNHSCSPNCTKLTQPFPSLLINIRTAVPIKKGQTMTISYMPSEGFCRQGRTERHQEIGKMGWAFHCQCQRCLDPTELGTFMDAVCCSDCVVNRKKNGSKKGSNNGANEDENQKGFFLPKNPINFTHSAVWTCTGCGVSKAFGILKNNVLDPLQSELEQIKKLGSNNDQKKEKILNFIQKNGGKIVHPNHLLVVNASVHFVQLLEEGQEVSLMTTEEFSQWKERREYLLAIEDVVAPGISQVRAFSLLWLTYYISTRIVHGEDPEEFDQKEKNRLLTSALKFNEEAALYFAYDKEVIESNRANSDTLAMLAVSIKTAMLAPERPERPPRQIKK